MRPANLAPILALFLAACAMPNISGVSQAPLSDPGACGAAGLSSGISSYIGKPASSLPTTGRKGAVRVITPGAPVTMDYSATRLNVHVDPAGTILTLTCG